MRQLNVIWSGREYYSLENCLVTFNEDSTLVDSVIVGMYNRKPYRVVYSIKCNQNRETIYCRVESQHDNSLQSDVLEVIDGTWFRNGQPVNEFDGCLEVDISLTPFTNTLPIRRLHLSPGGHKNIDVVYIDVLGASITRKKQMYRRMDSQICHYENIPSDFQADIQVDNDGLVIEYPALFERNAIVQSFYPERP